MLAALLAVAIVVVAVQIGDNVRVLAATDGSARTVIGEVESP